jgi:demethoxyubiquinone hydroxylase (CLK1/Coq7/Cat5 family)
MVSFGMLRRVALVKTDVSEEHIASIIRVTRIGELGTTLVVTSNRRTLRRNTTWYKIKKSPFFLIHINI